LVPFNKAAIDTIGLTVPKCNLQSWSRLSVLSAGCWGQLLAASDSVTKLAVRVVCCRVFSRLA
jgi:hypothetical protein